MYFYIHQIGVMNYNIPIAKLLIYFYKGFLMVNKKCKYVRENEIF